MDPDKKAHLKKRLSESIIPMWLDRLEQMLVANAQKQGADASEEKQSWFVGDKMTIADLWSFPRLLWLTSGRLEGIQVSGLLEATPNLTRNLRQVSKHPRVADWLSGHHGDETIEAVPGSQLPPGSPMVPGSPSVKHRSVSFDSN